jgi:hypothetical protein
MFFDVTPTGTSDLFDPVIKGLPSVPIVGNKASISFSGLSATLSTLQTQNKDG